MVVEVAILPQVQCWRSNFPLPPIPRSNLCKWIALPQAKKNVTQHNCYFNHCLLHRYTSYFTSHFNLLNICLLNQSNIFKTVYWTIVDSLHFHEHFRVSQISHWYHCEAEDFVYSAVWLVGKPSVSQLKLRTVCG